MAQWYLCSMGANLQPEQNFAKARSALQQLGEAYYSRAIYTKPVAMNSQRDFLNALFILRSEIDQYRLKREFNAIEQHLGRDRSDPLCGIKDRPMDIDILGLLSSIDDNHNQVTWQQVPDYLQTVVPNLRHLFLQLKVKQ